VYRCAQTLGLSGFVSKAAEGLIVEAEGKLSRVTALVETIRKTPPNAVIAGIETQEIALRGDDGFVIAASRVAGKRMAEVLPDLATCQKRLQELFDPVDR
jgi:hydrogenase maturation protein HypF